jgi:hypothetical protein
MKQCKCRRDAWRFGPAPARILVRFPFRPVEHLSPDSTDLATAAEAYARLDLPIIPLAGKIPAVRQWQQFVANAVNLRLWVGERRCNVGLRTGESGYVVVDTDTEEAERWVREHLPETPLKARSGGGSTHRYYAAPPRKEIRNAQGWRGIRGLDVRGQGGYIVLPPSVHPETGERYRWLTGFALPAGLPRFSPAWVYRRTRQRVTELIAGDIELRTRRARAYLARIEGAVSGQGGHDRTFRVACLLTQRFGLSFAEAWPLLLEWNERCRPPWSEKELTHKLQDSLKRKG